MKPEGVNFDSEWRSRCSVRPCKVSEVRDFIQSHYLQKRPAIVLLALAAYEGVSRIGCLLFSAPPREIEKRYGGKTWELARLYLLDRVPRNAETWFIGKAVRFVKQNHPDVRHLVSYADPSAGHSGTIYRASNWSYDGRTDEGRKTPRCDYVDTRTGKKYGRRGNVPPEAVLARVPRVSKHRFRMDI